LEKGIGCCWIGAFNKNKITKILNIPENYYPNLILALGYPIEQPLYEDLKAGSST
jgi:nitroreductase